MTRRTGPYPRVPALCNECGTQREVAWRTINKGGWYKCATCRQQTSHAIIAPADWGDYWEKKNGDSKDVQELQRLIDFIESRGVRVWWLDEPEGGIAEVRRHVEPVLVARGRCVTDSIAVNPRLPISEKIASLRWGWKALLPGESWDRCGPLVDGRGHVLIGLHRR